ncbi:Uncharacterized protein APZ42_008170, partial [Daphnia magna]
GHEKDLEHQSHHFLRSHKENQQAVDGVNCLFQTVVKNRIDPYGCKILLLEENIKQCSGSDPESVSNEVDDDSLANTIFQALA